LHHFDFEICPRLWHPLQVYCLVRYNGVPLHTQTHTYIHTYIHTNTNTHVRTSRGVFCSVSLFQESRRMAGRGFPVRFMNLLANSSSMNHTHKVIKKSGAKPCIYISPTSVSNAVYFGGSSISSLTSGSLRSKHSKRSRQNPR